MKTYWFEMKQIGKKCPQNNYFDKIYLIALRV